MSKFKTIVLNEVSEKLSTEINKAYHKHKAEVDPKITKVQFCLLLIEKQLQNETSK